MEGTVSHSFTDLHNLPRSSNCRKQEKSYQLLPAKEQFPSHHIIPDFFADCKIVWGISDLHNGIPEIFGNFFLRNRCGNNGIQLTAVHVCISLLTALIKLDLAFHIVFLTPLLKKIYLHTAFIDSHSGILKRRKIG